MGRISAAVARRLRRRPRERRRLLEAVGAHKYEEIAEQHLADGSDWLHARYAAAQNIASQFAEAASALEEFAPYERAAAEAEDEYLPSGPPMSPLTVSYFTSWALFDLRFGADNETVTGCLLDLTQPLGVGADLAATLRAISATYMGVYEHAGCRNGRVVLRELLSGCERQARPVSGYEGQRGELWFVRLCPPLDGDGHHVVFTTPYVLTGASKRDWTSQLQRHLDDAVDRNGQASLPQVMKERCWHEFVFLAFRGVRSGAIVLQGLPDRPDTLSHGHLAHGPA